VKISFFNKNTSEPYLKLYSLYQKAIANKQGSIDAISISSFNAINKEVESRFVNLKHIDDEDWIFYSNYNSQKAKDFTSHSQIAALLFWNTINIQIRIKANITKTSKEFNDNYFLNRSEQKNALAISSNQSEPVDSYKCVRENYQKSLERDNLKKCPDFWGGYSFTPYYFEFWEGHSSRLNKRDVYKKNGDNWDHILLQP
jgi:pyridoxamine-phosphate oxidase